MGEENDLVHLNESETFYFTATYLKFFFNFSQLKYLHHLFIDVLLVEHFVLIKTNKTHLIVQIIVIHHAMRNVLSLS